MNHKTFLSPSLLALLFCLGALLVSRTLADGKECKQPDGAGTSSSCVCQTDDGIIDLTPLSGKDGKPRFTGVQDKEGYEYDYNPCNPFNDETYSRKCTNVYICQGGVKDKTEQFIVGNQNEQIMQDGQKYYVHYESDDGKREGKVNLNCDQSTEGEIKSVTPDATNVPTIYIFELHSCHACPGGCVKKNVSGYIGIIIIVLALVAIVTYFIAGAVLMKVRYEATGSDIVPNKGFWIQLPLLIKDGCVFTVSPCIYLVRSRRNDYQKI